MVHDKMGGANQDLVDRCKELVIANWIGLVDR